ncbi:alpha/beta fold hydrolase [Candidatus Methanomassiliicoccus intestinalis]|uniref:alpha/beta fold hydrolase n=1 Tax=Candidatus Methanomassiliicoccus intestinalis TaxID=1406512 RepID=UPI0037DD456F
MEELTLKADDGLDLSIALFEIENPAAIVQIIHGMKEHKERYYDFIHFLNETGFSVVISDNRGHGKSLNDKFPLGHMEGCDQIIKDQYLITKYMKERYPGKKLYLIGHSFGSLLARCYLQQHDDEIDKLVLSGTVGYIKFINSGKRLGKIISFFKGSDGHSKILQNTVDGDDDTWICSDPEVMEAYRNDRLCSGYKYTNSANVTVIEGVAQLHDYNKYQCRNPDLKILSISGEEDPVTKGEEGLEDSMESLRKIGYKNITKIVYPKMKHEVLNEIGKEKVYEDVKNFLL